MNTITAENLEDKLIELIEKRNYRFEFQGGLNCVDLEKLRLSNDAYKKACYDNNSLSYSIYTYFKKKLEDVYIISCKNDTVQLFYKIKESLQRSEKYEEATGVIMFDLTSFTSNLIKIK